MRRVGRLDAAVWLGALCAMVVYFGAAARAGSTPVSGTRTGRTAAGARDTKPSLPRDSHDGLTISVDTYTDANRAKKTFGKANPLRVGILPVEVFLRNDTREAMRLTLDTIRLDMHLGGSGNQNIASLSPGDAALAIAYPRGPATASSPWGFGSSDKKVNSIEDILRSFSLDDISPPMSTIHGFLYFDMSRHVEWAANCSLYVPDVVTVPSNKVLIYFDVPLANAAQASVP